MDTCYIHLRRPWQYDRHTLYDGYANIYTFVKDMIKIKLAHLPLDEFDEGKDECKCNTPFPKNRNGKDKSE